MGTRGPVGPRGLPTAPDAEMAAVGASDGEALLAVATEFMVNEPGTAARASSRHRRTRNGRCSDCGHPGQRWPCFVATIALRAGSTVRGDTPGPPQ
jgi:hypothetical protein